VHDDESIELSGAVHGEELQDIQLHATRIDLSYLQQLFYLPDVIGGRATFQMQLTGTRAEPRFESALTVQPAASQRLPFTQFYNTLAYAQRQLQSVGRLHQGTREIVALTYLPIDLALTVMPLAQRLLEALSRSTCASRNLIWLWCINVSRLKHGWQVRCKAASISRVRTPRSPSR
jgi:hypothetical protein